VPIRDLGPVPGEAAGARATGDTGEGAGDIARHGRRATTAARADGGAVATGGGQKMSGRSRQRRGLSASSRSFSSIRSSRRSAALGLSAAIQVQMSIRPCLARGVRVMRGIKAGRLLP